MNDCGGDILQVDVADAVKGTDGEDVLAIVGSAPLASHCYLIVDDVGTTLVQFCACNKAVAFILPRVVDGYAQQLIAVEGLDMQDMLFVKARCCHIR